MPSHSRSSSAPSRPHTQALAHDVVGRRTPTAESSIPVRALKVDDLPEPVAPAIAITVCSAESFNRLEARSTISCPSSTRPSSSRPRECETAASRPLTRAPRSEPLETNFLAPSIKDRSEEHTSELQSLMRISYAVFCLKKKNKPKFAHN